MSAKLEKLRDDWAAEWPRALETWSKFTKLGEPRWCFTREDEKREGLEESFAMIRLSDQAVVIGLGQIAKKKLDRFAAEVLAHEIGHHIYCPSNLTDHGRMIARMRRALPTKEHLAPLVANLYADLLINDRLQRGAGLDMAGVYEALGGDSQDRMWTFYLRTYEILWGRKKGSLAKGPIDDVLEGDAQLGARVIRSYAGDWLRGAGKFAALCLSYLLPDDGKDIEKILKGWLDTLRSGGGGVVPAGLAGVEDGELDDILHPALDEEIAGERRRGPDVKGPPIDAQSKGGGGQYREPFEYGQILRSLGLELSDHEITIRYYRERAAPHLVPVPSRLVPQATEPLPEGVESWDIGSPLEEIDWLETVLRSPQVVPGMTTVRRTWGEMEGGRPAREAVDLDLYADCSGSMPNPQNQVSYLALAGAIVALSALRAGARVQATLWSGANQFQSTKGFVRDAHAVLGILTGYLGGGTAFPIHKLRDTYEPRKPGDRPVHILVISDDGVTTMFEKDELGGSGWDVSRMALERARGGGTMVLNLFQPWEKLKDLVKAHAMGWAIHRVQGWEDLVAFAREFSRANYGEKKRV